MEEHVTAIKEKSAEFKDLTQKLNRSGNKYNLRSGDLPPKTPALTVCSVGGGCTTIIDPKQISNTQYQTKDGGKAAMTIDRAIVHELFYSQHYGLSPLSSNLVSKHGFINNENRLMNQVLPSSPDRDAKNEPLFVKWS